MCIMFHSLLGGCRLSKLIWFYLQHQWTSVPKTEDLQWKTLLFEKKNKKMCRLFFQNTHTYTHIWTPTHTNYKFFNCPSEMIWWSINEILYWTRILNYLLGRVGAIAKNFLYPSLCLHFKSYTSVHLSLLDILFKLLFEKRRRGASRYIHTISMYITSLCHELKFFSPDTPYSFSNKMVYVWWCYSKNPMVAKEMRTNSFKSVSSVHECIQKYEHLVI